LPPAEPHPGTCASQEGVNVTGRVLASDNSAPVEGAYVFILRPGTKRKDVAHDLSNVESLVLTYTISDQNGAYYMPCPIPRDQSFTVLVTARHFVELSGDDVLSTSKAPDRFEPWN